MEKSAVGFFFLTLLLAFTHSSRIESKDVFAEIMAYGRERAISFEMMRGGKYQTRCYQTYMTKITEVAEQSKNNSETCLAKASHDRELQVQELKKQRLDLDEDVLSAQKSLNLCRNEKDDIHYLVCLRDDVNPAALTEIHNKSNSILLHLNDEYSGIHDTEYDCVQSVVEKGKLDTDAVFKALLECLVGAP